MITPRKYLAHFIDANMAHGFSGSYPSGSLTDYFRIGEHLESYAEELNPQVDQRKNILGDTVVVFSGYQPSGSVDTFYAQPGNKLYEAVENIALNRLTDDDCLTTCVDAKISVDDEATVEWAYMELCYIVPQSHGGDTSGIQIPFQIIKAGKRRRVTFGKSGNKWSITGVE